MWGSLGTWSVFKTMRKKKKKVSHRYTNTFEAFEKHRITKSISKRRNKALIPQRENKCAALPPLENMHWSIWSSNTFICSSKRATYLKKIKALITIWADSTFSDHGFIWEKMAPASSYNLSMMTPLVSVGKEIMNHEVILQRSHAFLVIMHRLDWTS